VALELRASTIAEIAERHPEALVASATPVPSVTALGDAAGVGERMLATRYGDPPLLSPVVELLAARDTPQRLLERVSQLLRALGKHPLVLRREVPGLVSGRLELAVLREALWLIERGVIEPEELDELVRDSLARQWALTGPLASAALAAPERLRELALAVHAEQPAGDAEALASLAVGTDGDRLAALRERRDDGLAAALRAERNGAPRGVENDG
jgi:3-hydroxyacyl-CoA dehydrogenase